MLSKTYLYAGMKKRVLVDLPEEVKKERNRLATKVYEVKHSEEMKTHIRDKGLEMILEVKPKDSGPEDKWTKRVV